jgi:hypothetical protein
MTLFTLFVIYVLLVTALVFLDAIPPIRQTSTWGKRFLLVFTLPVTFTGYLVVTIIFGIIDGDLMDALADFREDVSEYVADMW